MKKILQKGLFVFKIRYVRVVMSTGRKLWYKLSGMHVGKSTILSKVYVTWPHQISINDNCVIEHGTLFKFDGIWKEGQAIQISENSFIGSYCEFNISKSITIGKNALIASGCKFIDHDHGIEGKGKIRGQACIEESITIGDNVWLGSNVIILKGVGRWAWCCCCRRRCCYEIYSGR